MNTSQRRCFLLRALLPAGAVLALFVLTAAGPATRAQTPTEPSHFSPCAHRTGHNATVILPADAALGVGQAALAPGDEVAVYTPEGRCAGAVRWTGRNVALTVWGDNAATAARDGLPAGDSLHFRVWDASAEREYHTENSTLRLHLRDDRPHLRTRLTYAAGAIYVIDTLQVTPTAR